MPSAICPLSYDTVLDSNGRPLVGAKVFVYAAGTTQAADIYSDSDLTKPFGQPVLTTGYGRVPAIYLPPGSFRVRLTDPSGAIMDDVDNVQGAVVTTEVNNITNTGFQAPTGSLIPFYGTGAPSGWVRANGKTISGAGFSGSERADNDTEALFIQLWNADVNLAVSGGRGNTATSDFLAGKSIALPDLRRKVIAGLDGMGNGLLASAQGDPYTVLGSVFGEETHQISIAEMPNHSHTPSCDIEGGHTHVATADQQGSHSHVAGCDSQGDHVHLASSDQQGLHTHAAGADTQGDHNHAASMDAQGVHSHGASMDSQGSHAHNYSYYSYNLDGSTPSSPSAFANRDTQNSLSGNTDYQGAHVHAIVINGAGQHLHNITVQNAGGHTHNITVQNNGQHAHNITVADAGLHSHNVTIGAAGQHTHNITVNEAGDHTHVIAIAATGGSQAHNNMQPTMPMTWLIKL